MITDSQKIKPEDGDAPEFIEIINTIMGTLIFQYSLKEIVIVKIKNWFDHKWLNYSGKSVVKFDFGGMKSFEDRNDSALKNQWKQKISIPPFNPNRVIFNRFFYKKQTENKKIQTVIHRFRSSNDNIHNRIEDYISDGMAIWFSSNSKSNQRGSLMVYRVQESQVHTWYATIENRDGWGIVKTKGIGINELKAYIL